MVNLGRLGRFLTTIIWPTRFLLLRFTAKFTAVHEDELQARFQYTNSHVYHQLRRLAQQKTSTNIFWRLLVVPTSSVQVSNPSIISLQQVNKYSTTMGTHVQPSFLGVISPIYWGLTTFIFLWVLGSKGTVYVFPRTNTCSIQCDPDLLLCPVDLQPSTFFGGRERCGTQPRLQQRLTKRRKSYGNSWKKSFSPEWSKSFKNILGQSQVKIFNTKS